MKSVEFSIRDLRRELGRHTTIALIEGRTGASSRRKLVINETLDKLRASKFSSSLDRDHLLVNLEVQGLLRVVIHFVMNLKITVRVDEVESEWATSERADKEGVLPDGSRHSVLTERTTSSDFRKRSERVGGQNDLRVGFRVARGTHVGEGSIQSITDRIILSHERGVSNTNVLRDSLDRCQVIQTKVAIIAEDREGERGMALITVSSRRTNGGIGENEQTCSKLIELRKKEFLVRFKTAGFAGMSTTASDESALEDDILIIQLKMWNTARRSIRVKAIRKSWKLTSEDSSVVAERRANRDTELVNSGLIQRRVSIEDQQTKRVVGGTVVSAFSDFNGAALDVGLEIQEARLFVDTSSRSGTRNRNDLRDGGIVKRFETLLLCFAQKRKPGGGSIEKDREDFRLVQKNVL